MGANWREWTCSEGHHNRPGEGEFGMHSCAGCRSEFGIRTLNRKLIALEAVVLCLLAILVAGGEPLYRMLFQEKGPVCVIGVDNSGDFDEKSALQAQKHVEAILALPGNGGAAALLTVDAAGTAITGKDKILKAAGELKKSARPGNFGDLFAGAAGQVSAGRPCNFYLISSGKYEPEDAVYLEDLSPEEAAAQSVSLFEDIKERLKLPAGCTVTTLSLGEKPDTIILESVASLGKGKVQ